MNFKKLTRRLRREALANPKKAAILGLLVLVALYFWAPMVGGWIKEDQAAEDQPAPGINADFGPMVVAGMASAQPASTPTSPPPGKDVSYPWTQLDQWISQDPMTTPTEDLPERRDPFRVMLANVPTDETEQVEPDEPQVTPASLNLALSSTVVGPRRRLALIGGEAYEEGETVTVTQNDQPVEFQLVQVLPRRIVLRRHGEQFELRIPERESSGRITVSQRPN